MLYEIDRQRDLILKGSQPIQETRGWSEAKSVTVSQRIKEEAHDYRYFPDPDIPPIKLEQLTINNLQLTIPELPQQKRERFEKQYKLPKNFIDVLVEMKARSEYFEEAAKFNNNFKVIADLMINKNLDRDFPEPAGLVKKLVELTNVEYSSQDEVEKVVNLVVMNNQKALKDYQNGKGEVIGFLIGQVQKELRGKGNPAQVRDFLLKALQ